MVCAFGSRVSFRMCMLLVCRFARVPRGAYKVGRMCAGVQYDCTLFVERVFLLLFVLTLVIVFVLVDIFVVVCYTCLCFTLTLVVLCLGWWHSMSACCGLVKPLCL